MNASILLEVCVDSVESAVAAQAGGAYRIELCSGLGEGGITPSAGLLATVRQKISVPVFMMVRPRGGDFLFSSDEFAVMEKDIATAKQLAADGVVLGILRRDGSVDVERTRCLVELARPMQVTFHRAFDMASNLEEALEAVITTGANRVLTSGGEQSVESGIPAVKSLIQLAADRITVVAGAGIRQSNVRRIVSETGVKEIHASVSECVPSPMEHRNQKLSMGSVSAIEYRRSVVRSEDVRRLIAAANGS